MNKKLQEALNRLKKVLNQTEKFIGKQENKAQKPKKKGPSKKMEAFAEAVKKSEGWYAGSRAYRNNNPGNLRYSPYQSGTDDGYAYFETYDEGWKALLYQIELYATGRSAHTKGEETIQEFVDIWAPPSDNNHHNKNYAQRLANAIGENTNYKIKNLL